MVESLVDLHVHTTYSDGALSPCEVIELASQRQVGALSITDHDTVAAYHDPVVQSIAKDRGIELVTGIEISAFHDAGTSLHILGYYIDPSSSDITELTRSARATRREYAETVSRLFQRDGWALDTVELDVEAPTKALVADTIIGNPANVTRLARTFEDLPTRGRFIEALMNQGGEYFVERQAVSPSDAIGIIHNSGGVAFLAHPVALLYERSMSLQQVEDVIKTYDFDGIEALYYYFAKSQGDRLINESKTFLDLANRLGLLVSGGSDFHGHGGTVGNYLELGLVSEDEIIEHRPTQEMLSDIKQAAK